LERWQALWDDARKNGIKVVASVIRTRRVKGLIVDEKKHVCCGVFFLCFLQIGQ
jgi:hypothetical protein